MRRVSDIRRPKSCRSFRSTERQQCSDSVEKLESSVALNSREEAMQLKIPYGEHVRAEYRTLVARERQLRLPSCRKGTNAAEGLQFFLRPVKQSFSTESVVSCCSDPRSNIC